MFVACYTMLIMDKYKHQHIEHTWQSFWQSNAFDKQDKNNHDKEKFFVLDMLPYPSADGLHMGHTESYTASDIIYRFKRMQGYHVLHPQAFDSFGLPAENFAVKTGIHPSKTVKTCGENYLRQMKSLGFGYDYDDIYWTSSPEYYRWTQWLFGEFYKNDLVYKDTQTINWDPVDNTVLANEQVLPDGTAERSGAVVVQKEIPGWYFRIKNFADDLLHQEGDSIDWPEHTKKNQNAWIGKSEGAKIAFSIKGFFEFDEVLIASNNKGKIERYQGLVEKNNVSVKFISPDELGQKNLEVEEDQATLVGNAKKKALAYAKEYGRVCLANDTGFYIKGENLDPVKVKRNALEGRPESDFTQEEISQKTLDFYIDIATKHGGEVEAEWREAWALATPEGSVRVKESVRPVILTNTLFGEAHPQMLVRALYKSRVTGKPALEETEEEYLREMKPVTDAIFSLLSLQIEVFTTRPDTLFGATYMVLAPEHELVSTVLGSSIENWDEVMTYVSETERKTELERLENKNKTGVMLEGIWAINPANGEEIPVYIADYVLAGYGTGAIMAVPAHDERDYEFACKYNSNISLTREKYGHLEEIDEHRQGVYGVITNDKGEYLIQYMKTRDLYWFPGGTMEEGESQEETVRREIKEETGYVDLTVGKFLKTVTFDTTVAEPHPKAGMRIRRELSFYEASLNSSKQVPVEFTESEIADGAEFVWMSLEEVYSKLETNHDSNRCDLIRNVIGSHEKGRVSHFTKNIPIKQVLAAQAVTHVGALLKIGGTDEYIFHKKSANHKLFPNIITTFGGGREAGESTTDTLIRELKEELGITIRVDDLGSSFQSVSSHEGMHFLAYELEINIDDISLLDTGEVVRATLDTILERDDIASGLEKVIKQKLGQETIVVQGQLINSGEFDGMTSEEAKVAITEKVGGEITSTYRLKDWSISRQRYWGTPIPIVYDPEGKAHLIPEEHLPWTLPTDVDFVPKGTAPLADSKELLERTESIFGKGWRPEVDTMDTFVCSSWYFLRYADPHNTTAWCNKKNKEYWQPVDLYIGGVEHTYMHLLYARFWVKAMQSIGLLDYHEPFTTLRHQGYVLDAQGKKMSKSKGNVVNPDEVVERFGADATRLYMMFAGPLEDEITWNENGVVGMYRFIEKVWRQKEKLSEDIDQDIRKTVHKTIKKVTHDIEKLRFNTAISAMMIAVNQMDKAQAVHRDDYQALVKLVSVFAPHVSQEIMHQLGREEYISDMVWPEYEESQTIDSEIELAVQIQGKTRGSITLSPDASEETALALARGNASLAKWLEGEVVQVIYLPGRILNIVVKS